MLVVVGPWISTFRLCATLSRVLGRYCGYSYREERVFESLERGLGETLEGPATDNKPS